MPHVTILSGPLTGRSVALDPEKILLIGRGTQCDVVTLPIPKALEKNPAERQQTPREFVREMELARKYQVKPQTRKS